MSEDAFEDGRWYEAGRIRERRERAELDAAVKELLSTFDEHGRTAGVVVDRDVKVLRVRELMKKAGK